MSKHEPSLSGTVGDKLEVKLGGEKVVLDQTLVPGQVVEAPKAVRASRAATLRALPKQAASVRRLYRELSTEIIKDVKAVRRTASGRLPKPTEVRLRKKIERRLKGVSSSIQGMFKSNILQAAEREVRAQSRALKSLGLPPLTLEAQSRLAEKVAARVFREPFPGTSQTTTDRVSALQARAAKLGDSVLRADEEMFPRRARQLGVGLHDTRPGSPREVPGGSVGKSLERINRTEQQRAAHESAVALGMEVGLQYAYWRLSPMHKWYGGNEICEKLAAQQGPGVEQALLSDGDDPGRHDTRGLYLLVKFPEVPHPNCMCQVELWLPIVSGGKARKR